MWVLSFLKPNPLFQLILILGCTTIGSSRQHRSINQALQANGEMLRLSGLPARGWYPKQRNTRSAASTEHLDRLHQGSIQRAWDTGTAARKPTTLPPNITPPKFFNKSPRDALRRVTSLLIRGKGKTILENVGKTLNYRLIVWKYR